MIVKNNNIMFLFIIAFYLTGCALRWQPAVEEASSDQPTPQSMQLLSKARQLYEKADDRESLAASMDSYEAVLSVNPGDYESLVQLSNQTILMGTAYTSSKAQKKILFLKAMRYAELAMYTNPEFKDAVNGGKAPWEAAGALNNEQTRAMFFWVTALQYQFKEGMGLAGKIRNVDWMKRGLLFLNRIEKTDPKFGDGAVEFAKAICLYVLPKSRGGSKERGIAYMQRAVDRGKNRLLPRWGRGKYFYAMIGEDEKSHEDLNWVVSRNIDDVTDPYPWRIHFQKDARQLMK